MSESNGTKVIKTTNYDQFKGVVGNRKVIKNHVVNLTKAVARKNMLPANPIIVNGKMEVIDGQHRLEVARANKLPIYYVVVDDAKLVDVQQLNAYVRPWRGIDYLESYASVGLAAYVTLKEFMQEYNLPFSTALEVLGGIRQTGWTQFKRGEFKVSNLERARLIAEALIELKPHTEAKVSTDKDYIRAVMDILEEVSSADIIAKLEASGKTIEPRVDKKSYIRQFEDILNWKSRGDFIRLY